MNEANQQPTASEAPGLRELFKIRDFRALWGGQVVSDFGDGMTSLALLLLVNKLTGSTTALATMAIMLAIPQLTFGLAAGVYVDRLDRKKIMIFSDLLRGIFVLGFLLVDSPDKLWILYTIGFIQSTIGTFFNPARGALLPNIVPKESLLAANSIAQTSMIIFRLVGTGAAGGLIGFFEGYWEIFIIDAITFFVSLMLISRIRYIAPQSQHDSEINFRTVVEELAGGLSVTFSNRILTGSIAALSVTMLGLGAVNILLVPLLVNDLQIKETWFVVLELAQTSSMILSSGLVAVLAARFRSTNILSAGLIGLGAGVAALALPSNVWHVVVILFAVGWFITPVQAAVQTIIQTAVPDELRGRTGAANNAMITTANLVSMAMAGMLGDTIGVRNVFVVGGGLVALAGVLSGVIFRGVEAQVDGEPVQGAF
ncbi:MAG: MFS transporter [Anaerolineae bacterium]|nr:MFS transporter [Anaerolineae bacterium]